MGFVAWIRIVFPRIWVTNRRILLTMAEHVEFNKVEDFPIFFPSELLFDQYTLH